ncbi:MAG: peptidoglycan-binding domain-containing protein [Albidovulum sp.]
MRIGNITKASLICAVSFAPVQQAAANDGLVGGIVGGIIGGVIVNEASKNRKQKTTRRAAPVYSATREANREVQVALNYFGYPVGAADGALGRRSRAAISQYQALLGYPPTGYLSEYERTILIGAYYRGLSGGSQVAQIMASSPQGTRGLLLNQRDEMAGIAPQGGQAVTAAAPSFAAPSSEAIVAPSAPTLAPLAEVPSLPTLAVVPEPEAPALDTPTLPALPTFLASGAGQVSLASQCNKVSLMTNTNGGYVTAAAMTDANFALSEQFCLARTYAMAGGEQLAASINGFTPAQIAEQCKGFGPALKDQVSGLSLKSREEVLQDVYSFVVASGRSRALLAGTAKTCLGVGYTTVAMDVAISSALLLTALGENGYSELLGHHLSQGFGATVRPDLSLAWYEAGIAADGAGKAVFAPGLPDRTEVIRKAAYTINGQGSLNSEAATTLPVFALTQEPQAAETASEVAATTAPAQPSVSPIGAAALATSTVFSNLGAMIKN